MPGGPTVWYFYNLFIGNSASWEGLLNITIDYPGTGYALGDELNVLGGGISAGGTVIVTAVGMAGEILTAQIDHPGINYTSGVFNTSYYSPPGNGTGALINVTANGQQIIANLYGSIGVGLLQDVNSWVTPQVTNHIIYYASFPRLGNGPIKLANQYSFYAQSLADASTVAVGFFAVTPSGGTQWNAAFAVGSILNNPASGMTWAFEADGNQLATYRYGTNVVRTSGTVMAAPIQMTNAAVASQSASFSFNSMNNIISLGGLLTVGVNASGSGYAVNDQVLVSGAGSGTALLKVTAISGGGAVVSLSIVHVGYGYVAGTHDIATTNSTGVGTGLAINVLTVGNSLISNLIGSFARAVDLTGSTATPTITNAIAFQAGNNILGSGPGTIVTQIGLDVLAMTAVSTNTYGVRIAAQTGGLTANNGIFFTLPAASVSSGIVWGTDPIGTNLYRSQASVLTTDGDFAPRHIMPHSAGLPGTVLYSAAGAGATIVLTAGSTDCRGQITLNTGTGTTGSNIIFTIDYNVPFTVFGPGVVVVPRNGASAALSGNGEVYVGVENGTGFTVAVGLTPLATNTTYMWNYQTCA